MAPSLSSWRTGAITNASAIWTSAGPSTGWRRRHTSDDSTYPPLIATISPRAMAAFAKRPRPSIGLAFTSVFRERYVRSATASLGTVDARRQVRGEQASRQHHDRDDDDRDGQRLEDDVGRLPLERPHRVGIVDRLYASALSLARAARGQSHSRPVA